MKEAQRQKKTVRSRSRRWLLEAIWIDSVLWDAKCERMPSSLKK